MKLLIVVVKKLNPTQIIEAYKFESAFTYVPKLRSTLILCDVEIMFAWSKDFNV